MASRQIIAVIGATGATAGGLADPDRRFDLRAITRTPNSPAAGAAGVGHVIWSTAEDTRETPVGSRLPVLEGGYVVPNWDGRGAGDRYFAEAGCPRRTCSRPSTGSRSSSGWALPSPVPTECAPSRCRWARRAAEVFRSLPFPGADLAANMFEFVEGDPGYADRRDAGLARELNPDLTGFDVWAASTAP